MKNWVINRQKSQKMGASCSSQKGNWLLVPLSFFTSWENWQIKKIIDATVGSNVGKQVRMLSEELQSQPSRQGHTGHQKWTLDPHVKGDPIMKGAERCPHRIATGPWVNRKDVSVKRALATGETEAVQCWNWFLSYTKVLITTVGSCVILLLVWANEHALGVSLLTRPGELEDMKDSGLSHHRKHRGYYFSERKCPDVFASLHWSYCLISW